MRNWHFNKNVTSSSNRLCFNVWLLQTVMIHTTKHIHSSHFPWTPIEPQRWKDVCLKVWNKLIHCHPYTKRNTLHVFHAWLLQLAFQTLKMQRMLISTEIQAQVFVFRHYTLQHITSPQSNCCQKSIFSTSFFPFIEPLIQWLSPHYLSAQP